MGLTLELDDCPLNDLETPIESFFFGAGLWSITNQLFVPISNFKFHFSFFKYWNKPQSPSLCSKAMHIFCIVSVSDRAWCWVLMNTHVFSQVWRRPGSDPIYIYCWQKYRINQNVSPESNIVIRSECLSVLVSHGVMPRKNGVICNCLLLGSREIVPLWEMMPP